MSRIEIETLNKTCDACPAQWEGKTTDGQYVYIRYRWGVLTMGYDANKRNAILIDKVSLEVGGSFDGTMQTAEMVKHLLPYVSFGGLG